MFFIYIISSTFYLVCRNNITTTVSIVECILLIGGIAVSPVEVSRIMIVWACVLIRAGGCHSRIGVASTSYLRCPPLEQIPYTYGLPRGKYFFRDSGGFE